MNKILTKQLSYFESELDFTFMDDKIFLTFLPSTHTQKKKKQNIKLR